MLGSGPSINDIPEQRWRTIARHDSIAFNLWPAHDFIPKIYLFENIIRSQNVSMYDALHSLLLRRATDYQSVTKVICTLSEPYPLEQGQMVLDLPKALRSNLFVTFPTAVVARDERELQKGMRYLRRRGVFDPANHVAWHFMSDVRKARQSCACRATTAFASLMARPSSPVRCKASFATFAQSSCSSSVVALCMCLSASFAVQGI